jgi:putative transposase
MIILKSPIMQFEEGSIYHIYNRGNNSQKLFFKRENYLFFKDKIVEFILPHVDIMAWCLMPTHFHFMVEIVNEYIQIPVKTVTNSEIIEPPNLNDGNMKMRSLNDSLGIVLRSYARAIQNQEKITGSLFQKNTKAICLNESGLSSAWFETSSGTLINIDDPETDYLAICFSYIHNNPVTSGLVLHAEDWEFSSFGAYKHGRKDKLLNKDKALQLGLI